MNQYCVDLNPDEELVVAFFVKTSGYGSIPSYLKYMLTYGDAVVQDIVQQMINDYKERGDKFCKEEGVSKEEIEKVIHTLNKLKRDYPERYTPRKL